MAAPSVAAEPAKVPAVRLTESVTLPSKFHKAVTAAYAVPAANAAAARKIRISFLFIGFNSGSKVLQKYA